MTRIDNPIEAQRGIRLALAILMRHSLTWRACGESHRLEPLIAKRGHRELSYLHLSRSGLGHSQLPLLKPLLISDYITRWIYRNILRVGCGESGKEIVLEGHCSEVLDDSGWELEIAIRDYRRAENKLQALQARYDLLKEQHIED